MSLFLPAAATKPYCHSTLVFIRGFLVCLITVTFSISHCGTDKAARGPVRPMGRTRDKVDKGNQRQVEKS